jgi:hypothetical protein
VDPGTGILLLTIAAFVGVAAVLILLAARGRMRPPDEESPFAASSEGMTTCRICGHQNLTTDTHCLSCGAELPVHQDVS